MWQSNRTIGPSSNNVTALRGEVSRILWQHYLSLSTKKHDDGGRGGSKINKNCVTSFMDDPQVDYSPERFNDVIRTSLLLIKNWHYYLVHYKHKNINLCYHIFGDKFVNKNLRNFLSFPVVHNDLSADCFETCFVERFILTDHSTRPFLQVSLIVFDTSVTFTISTIIRLKSRQQQQQQPQKQQQEQQRLRKSPISVKSCKQKSMFQNWTNWKVRLLFICFRFQENSFKLWHTFFKLLQLSFS
jgi:hypothetical protein